MLVLKLDTVQESSCLASIYRIAVSVQRKTPAERTVGPLRPEGHRPDTRNVLGDEGYPPMQRHERGCENKEMKWLSPLSTRRAGAGEGAPS